MSNHSGCSVTQGWSGEHCRAMSIATSRSSSRARELDLEVAMDIALQCSPDHPWVTEHPEWFDIRPDGSIAYAENPRSEERRVGGWRRPGCGGNDVERKRDT